MKIPIFLLILSGSFFINAFTTEAYWYGTDIKVWIPCGSYATENNSGGCTCKKGFVVNKSLNRCEPTNKYTMCIDPINGYLDSDGKCYCNQGYLWNNSLNRCVKGKGVYPSYFVR